MYVDQVEAQSSRSVKDRLHGNFTSDSDCRRTISGKRQREDDGKWEHDVFKDNMPNRRVGASDLRAKLQRKSTQSVRGSVSGGAGDLREKLSGALNSRRVESKPLPAGPKLVPEVSKPTRKSVIAQAHVPETKVASSVSKIKVQPFNKSYGSKKILFMDEWLLKMAETVESFLQSLGLEKYSITFQAEEVDMTALMHISDEDLKALGVPMGPRKKILLAMESNV